MTKSKCFATSLTLLLALILTPAAAQKSKSAQDRAVDEVCACLQKLDAKKMTEAQKAEAGQNCMVEGLTKHLFGLAEEYDVKIADLNEETGRKIGEKFGVRLIEKCPASLPFLVSVGQAELAKENNDRPIRQKAAPTDYGATGETEGVLQKVDTEGDFVKLHVKTIEGDTEIFYWIRPFNGSEMLEDKPARHVGKKVLIGWQEFKRYVPSVKGYGKEREISSLLMLN